MAPSKALTEIAKSQFDYILVDGSGSMQDKWWDFLGSIDTYVATLKTNATNTHIRLSVFAGDDLDMIGRDSPIDSWLPMSEDPIGSTWGGTPLFDAINIMGRNLRDINPSRCAITIVTDGDNNCSNFTDLIQAKSILDWCRAKGWQITFIGCDFNNSRQARLLGANDSTSVGVQKHLLSDAAANLANKRSRYATSGAPMHFSDSEKQQFGGLLADHSRGK